MHCQVVNKIAYGDWGVSVSTEDGATYTAKAAIATVSLGVLQSKLINFEPDLPVSVESSFFQTKTLYCFEEAKFFDPRIVLCGLDKPSVSKYLRVTYILTPLI